jgi:hypothetical protein
MALVIGTIRPTDRSFRRTTTIAATVALSPLNLSSTYGTCKKPTHCGRTARARRFRTVTICTRRCRITDYSSIGGQVTTTMVTARYHPSGHVSPRDGACSPNARAMIRGCRHLSPSRQATRPSRCTWPRSSFSPLIALVFHRRRCPPPSLAGRVGSRRKQGTTDDTHSHE